MYFMLQFSNVKGYIVTMTIWSPDLSVRRGPRYLAIADALAEDIAKGNLVAGERLPTHRDLAWKLGVTVGTVSRAYAEADRRGLLSGEIGRGTFVLKPADNCYPILSAPPKSLFEFIDLRQARPPAGPAARALRETLLRIAESPNCGGVLGYQQERRNAAFSQTAADWLRPAGLRFDGDEIVPTLGAQGAISLCLSTFLEPGDRLALGSLSYHSMQALARQSGIRLTPLDLDEEGLLPESFEAACRSHQIKALYCIPVLQNPTTGTLSLERRRAIARIAEHYDVAIIEDDIFRLLLDSAPPSFKELVPKRTFYITSFSKTLDPGLRLGMLVPPRNEREKARQSVTTRCITLPPLMQEISSDWIKSGQADQILLAAKEELMARREMLFNLLGRWEVRCPAGCPFAWLELPEPWQSASFAAEMRAYGVGLSTANDYAVGRHLPQQAIRIGIGAASSRDALEQGLMRITALLEKEPIATSNPLV
jgi:DNA-binding transcriptional MocR family regulator